jgi:hypothetical protein
MRRILPVTLGLAAVLACLACLACKKTPEAGPPGGTSEGAARAAVKPPVEGELVITATLKDIAGPFPANDIYNYAYVMRYEVDKVHQGAYPGKDILVGHYNPRFAREEVKDDQDPKVGGNVKSFQVGDRHYLVLSPLDGIWTGAVEDEYYKDKRPRHWALWADMAPSE